MVLKGHGSERTWFGRDMVLRGHGSGRTWFRKDTVPKRYSSKGHGSDGTPVAETERARKTARKRARKRGRI